MKKPTITVKDVLLAMNDNQFSKMELVSILEVAAYKSGILTISEMARKEGKSPNGIRGSKKYLKTEIGTQLMCFKGLDDNNLPF